MKQKILKKLRNLEEDHEVKIIYAVESGSRAWGFASEDSDYDVRFIYQHPVKKYLSLVSPKDVIHLPIHEALDFHGWDLFKAGKLLLRSNPSLIEWLYSPIVYVEQGIGVKKMRDWVQTQVSLKRLGYHYLNMAQRNYKDFIQDYHEIQAKKYMYILRSLFCLNWLEQHESVPPVSVWELLPGLSVPSWCKEKFHALIEQKIAHENVLISADQQLHVWSVNEIARFQEKITSFPDHKANVSHLDEIILSQLDLL